MKNGSIRPRNQQPERKHRASRTGVIAVSQQVHLIAQIGCALQAPGADHTGLRGAERSALPDERMGHAGLRQHHLQRTERRASQKRRIFNSV
jgi:hypothetical protein